jgi:gelsolin
LDHKIKQAAADGETAWDVIGSNVGLYIWRMEQFRVVPVPNEQYGSFYSGDSYIVLNSYKKDDMDTLYHDIHMWIGNQSSQDEYGTAAYKMVEADEFLGGTAVQYRQVQNHESSLFTSYFPNGVQYMEGGTASGFTHVETIVEVPRLYRVKGTMHTMSLKTMESVTKSNLNSNDSFILYVNNSTVYVWHGSDASPSERNKANSWSESLCTNGTVVTMDQGSDDTDATFWSYFPDSDGEIPTTAEDGDDADVEDFQPKLYQLSPNGAELIATSTVSKSMLNPDDVFLFDSGWTLYVWIGKTSDSSEKLNAITWAHTFCTTSSNDPARTSTLPITMMKDGYETSTFLEYFTE